MTDEECTINDAAIHVKKWSWFLRIMDSKFGNDIVRPLSRVSLQNKTAFEKSCIENDGKVCKVTAAFSYRQCKSCFVALRSTRTPEGEGLSEAISVSNIHHSTILSCPTKCYNDQQSETNHQQRRYEQSLIKVDFGHFV